MIVTFTVELDPSELPIAEQVAVELNYHVDQLCSFTRTVVQHDLTHTVTVRHELTLGTDERVSVARALGDFWTTFADVVEHGPVSD